MEAETEKIKEYRRNRDFPPSALVPLGVDWHGSWGPPMKQFVDEIHDDYKEAMATKHSPALRYAREAISIAVAMAANVYIATIRGGCSEEKKPWTSTKGGENAEESTSPAKKQTGQDPKVSKGRSPRKTNSDQTTPERSHKGKTNVEKLRPEDGWI